MSNTFTVDFVGVDLGKVEGKAEARGYGNVVDYIRDCALGKFEQKDEDTYGVHVQNALLVYEIARTAFIKTQGDPAALRHFLEILGEELVVAAENERLG